MNRRAIVASLAALPFVRPTAAATIPDIHQLQPEFINTVEQFGSIKQATVLFADASHAPLIGKTYGFYGTALVCTKELQTQTPTYVAYFEEINLDQAA